MNKLQEQKLEDLKKVIKGVREDGRSSFLMGDYDVMHAIEACHRAGIALHKIKEAIRFAIEAQ